MYFSARVGMPVGSRSNAQSHLETISRNNIKADRKAGIVYSERNGVKTVFTIDPKLQSIAERLLIKYDPVVGVFAAIEPKTGAVKALAVYTRKNADLVSAYPFASFLDPIARNSTYPMASIAKIVTSAAAFRLGLSSPSESYTCTGRTVVKGGSVSDAVGESHGPITTSEAFARSCNSTFAKIAMKIGRTELMREYDDFLFNRRIPFDFPLLESTAAIPEGDIGLANTGAGYRGATMSPLHAALIAATIANGGKMPAPYIVQSMMSGGKVKYRAKRSFLLKSISEKTARQISEMMVSTVHQQGCTAYKGFYKNGRYTAGDARVVGKTGSLNGNDETESFTWFVGHVQNENPDIAIATMIMNDGMWKIKAASYTGQFFTTLANEKD